MSDSKAHIDELLKKRIAKAKGRVATSTELERREDRATSPCTPPQERFYFLQKSRPDSVAYNMYAAFRIKGQFDRDHFRECIKMVISKHEAIRSRIVESREGSLSMRFDLRFEQVYSEETKPNIDKSDIVDLASRVYDLNEGPLYRLRLLSTPNGLDHALLIEAHHIVADEASLSIVCRELFDLYGRSVETEVSSVVDFGDYAESLKEKNKKGVYAKELNYWVNTLKDLPENRDLNLGSALAVNEMTGAMVRLEKSKTSWSNLEQFARRLKTTPFVVCLTALHAFLYKVNAIKRNPVGIPFSNRDSPTLEAMPGLLLNTLVSSLEIESSKSFEENVLQCRDHILNGFQNGHAALDEVVKRLNPDRTKGNPLFDVMLVQFDPPEIPDIDGLDISRIDLRLAVSKFDLSFFFEEVDGNLSWAVEYSDSMYTAQTAEHLIQLFDGFLSRSINQSLDLISSHSIDPSLSQFISGKDLVVEKSFLDSFREVVAMRAEGVALKSGDVEMSYADLDRRSEALANELHKRYASNVDMSVSFKSRPVGIMLDRSIEGILLMIACLKARIPYVPLDPKYPDALLNMLKGKAGLSFIIGSGTDSIAFSELNFEREFDEDWRAQYEIEERSEDIAYIIYTSGSTGTPKGVYISHANLAASTQARFEYYDEDVESYLLLSSFAFDSSVAGIYWTLQSGGTLVLPEPGSENNAKYLLDTIERESITHTLCLPSLYDVLLRYDESAQLKSLKTIIVAGEACPRSLLSLHAAKNSEAALYNEYGPTEATVWSSVEKIDPDLSYADGVSIGGPIPGVELVVLDADQQIGPREIPGQLAISGPTLSPGYWKSDHESNANRFTTIDGKRFYLTGDLVRLRKNDKLDFLGRIDQQAKVNGYRVELESIKLVLESLGGVDEAHLSLADGRIVALAKSNAGLDQEKLKAMLAELLPPYQIPSKILLGKEIPRLGNGKIDFSGMQLVDIENGELQKAQTEDEILLQGIWQDLLEIEEVGVNQNFFDLGGHSLLAIRLFAEIENRTGHRLPLSSVIENPTIFTLAKRISTPSVSEDTFKYLVPFGTAAHETAANESLKNGKSKGTILCAHAGGGNVLFYEPLARHLEEFEVFGIQAPPPEEEFPESVEALCELYLEEIRRGQIKGPYTLVGRCFGTAVALVLANRLKSLGEEVNSLIILDSQIPMPSAKALGIPEKTLMGKSAAAIKLLSEGKWRMVGDEIYSRTLRISQRYITQEKSSETDSKNDYYQVAAANLTEAMDKVLVHFKAESFDGNVFLVKSSEYEKRKEYAVIEEEWRTLCEGDFYTDTIATSHRKIFIEPAVSKLGQTIRRHLESVSH